MSESNLTELLKKHGYGTINWSHEGSWKTCEIPLNAEINLALIKSIHRSSEASDMLGRKMFWLNVILSALTAVGVAFTAAQFFK